MSKFAVHAHPDGTLRYQALGPSTDGNHRVFDATCDIPTRTARIIETTAHFTDLDPTLPLFIRNYFGQGQLELIGHVTVPFDANPLDWLLQFTNRLLASASGRKGSQVDDRNRNVFWKTVEFLTNSGPLDLTKSFTLFNEATSPSTRFNF